MREHQITPPREAVDETRRADRRRRLVVGLAAFAVLATGAVTVPAVAGPRSQPAVEPACGASPPPNGTGHRPPATTASLPTGSPRPGPAVLHRPLATSPQLENSGPWRAAPTLVSGTHAYRDGEFLYQDFLYDDRALAYPAEPARYAGNAADIVEVRLKPLRDALAVRITYNSMLVPDAVATTIALGTSARPHPLPHGAGSVAPAEVFVTASGCRGDVVRASDGRQLATRPLVSTDLLRRQTTVEIPYTVFDPRGRRDVRVAAAAGLWDVRADAYRRPDATRPAFYNVAFRDKGPWVQTTWKDESQNAALAAGDLTPLHAVVDFRKLAAGVDDDLPGDPRGVPTSGPMNRIMVSHFEDRQGRGAAPVGSSCGAYCEVEYSGRLQPYSVYVPRGPVPRTGYGLTVNLHGAGSNHNHFEGGDQPPPATWRMLAEAGRPSIMAMPNARGVGYFYKGLAAVDVFEMWADVAGHYRLDPGYVVLTGSSMGGFGTLKLGEQYPDLFTAVMPNIAATGVVIEILGPSDPDFDAMLASLRNVPVVGTFGVTDPVSQTSGPITLANLERLGYRYDHWFFGRSDGTGHKEFRHYVRDVYRSLTEGAKPIDRDPRRVTYVVNQDFTEPARLGLTADHAYWVSGVAPRAGSPAVARVDVTSHAFPSSDPSSPASMQTAGPGRYGSDPFVRSTRRWGPAPLTPSRDALTVSATNVRTVTLDVNRARVSCAAPVDVTSDGPLTVRLVGGGCRRVVSSAG